ncbi:MAG: 4-hydroxybenzoyl-CoA reductase subunit beta [Burkholderiaceae bacterium]
MTGIAPFTLHRPTTVADASALLAQVPGACLVAGGTDLIPNLRRGIGSPHALIDLSAIEQFAHIASDAHGWRLGAGVTLAALLNDAGIAGALPALHEAAASVAGPGHRTVATLGGNLCLDTRCVFFNQSEWWRRSNAYCLKLGGETCHVAPQGKRCHAAFSGDVAPALLALGAQVEVAGVGGTRRLPLAELYVEDGIRPLTLAAGELVAAVLVPPQPAGARSGYRKARIRGAMDFPLAGVAVRASFQEDRLDTLRVALTGVSARPVLLEGAESLCGQAVDDALLAALAKRINRQISPVRTTVSSAYYRRQVAIVMAQRLLRQLATGEEAPLPGKGKPE